MAIREFYLGSVGPFYYDDTATIDNPISGLHGETYHGLLCEGQIEVLTAPSVGTQTVRLTDMDGRVYASTEVADINDPSAELNLLSSIVGSILFVYEEIPGGPDEWTQYVYDDNIGAENPPYIVDGSIAGEGWVAVGGRYSNINTIFDYVAGTTGIYIGLPATAGTWKVENIGGSLVWSYTNDGTSWEVYETWTP